MPSELDTQLLAAAHRESKQAAMARAWGQVPQYEEIEAAHGASSGERSAEDEAMDDIHRCETDR